MHFSCWIDQINYCGGSSSFISQRSAMLVILIFTQPGWQSKLYGNWNGQLFKQTNTVLPVDILDFFNMAIWILGASGDFMNLPAAPLDILCFLYIPELNLDHDDGKFLGTMECQWFSSRYHCSQWFFNGFFF